MKDRIIPILMVLGLSLFCGIISSVGGLGTLTSPLNRIAGPNVCGERELQIEKDSSAYIQGEQTHKVTAYCVDAVSGDKQDVSVELMAAIQRLQVITGVVITIVAFAILMLLSNWAARRLGLSFSELFQPSVKRS